MDPVECEESLGEDILHCFAGNVAELHTCQADFVTAVSEKPLASPLAVYQANHGLPIVNQRHESITIDSLSKETLKTMNGNRDVEAVLRRLIEKALATAFIIQKNGMPVSGEGNITRALEESIGALVQNLADMALLIS